MRAVESGAVVRYTDAAGLAEALSGADALFVYDFLSTAVPGAWHAADRLRWLHIASAGVDPVLFPGLRESDVVLTNSRGVFDDAIAEYVLGVVLAFAKDFARSHDLQREGRWLHRESERIAGREVVVVGTGPIGRAIARLLRAAGMRVSGAGRRERTGDPDFGVVHESARLTEILPHADYVVAVAPLTEHTKGMFAARAFAAMKPSARFVNVGRGELVVTSDLVEALESKAIAGAALDVFDTEPAEQSPLFALENVVCTPHLGAATAEAQENVALQIAEQMSDFLLTGAVANAINMPSVSAEDAPRLKPYMELCRLLGAFAGQLTQAREGVIRRVLIEYEGLAAALNTRPLSAAALAGLMTPVMEGVNMVNAPVAARDHGIDVAETVHDRPSEYQTLVRVTVETDRLARSVAGTLFAGSRPRIVEIKGIKVEADFAPHMLYVTNQDKPGFIGRFGATLAGAGINIATFHLGRASQGGDAICLVSVDEEVPEDVLSMVRTLPLVVQATSLAF